MGSHSEAFDTAKLIENCLRPPDEIRRQFQKLDDIRYRLTLEEIGTAFEIDRLRRDRGELIGELGVYCDLPGIKTFEGIVSIADFNLSSARARTDRIKLLIERAPISGLDWAGLLEEFCKRVISAYRAGNPIKKLTSFEKAKNDETINIDGVVLPKHHPAILFGDGASAKSYTALYIGGRLAKQGFTVALFDWELQGPDQRDRLERLFGDVMPEILYARCYRTLSDEAERLKRMVQEHKINYAIFDSVAYGCDGPPESAEIAMAYMRTVEQICPGSLSIAHISKQEGSDQKPFGSAFWHNGARSTYFVKCINSKQDRIDIGLFHRKSNLGRLYHPTGFKIVFTDEETIFTRTEPAEVPELAEHLTLKQRMIHLLKAGALTSEQISEELSADLETVRRTVRRHKQLFTVIEGKKVGLLQ